MQTFNRNRLQASLSSDMSTWSVARRVQRPDMPSTNTVQARHCRRAHWRGTSAPTFERPLSTSLLQRPHHPHLPPSLPSGGAARVSAQTRSTAILYALAALNWNHTEYLQDVACLTCINQPSYTLFFAPRCPSGSCAVLSSCLLRHHLLPYHLSSLPSSSSK